MDKEIFEKRYKEDVDMLVQYSVERRIYLMGSLRTYIDSGYNPEYLSEHEILRFLKDNANALSNLKVPMKFPYMEFTMLDLSKIPGTVRHRFSKKFWIEAGNNSISIVPCVILCENKELQFDNIKSGGRWYKVLITNPRELTSLRERELKSISFTAKQLENFHKAANRRHLQLKDRKSYGY